MCKMTKNTERLIDLVLIWNKGALGLVVCSYFLGCEIPNLSHRIAKLALVGSMAPNLNKAFPHSLFCPKRLQRLLPGVSLQNVVKHQGVYVCVRGAANRLTSRSNL